MNKFINLVDENDNDVLIKVDNISHFTCYDYIGTIIYTTGGYAVKVKETGFEVARILKDIEKGVEYE